MKSKAVTPFIMLVCVCAGLNVAQADSPNDPNHPAIANFGTIHPRPNAAEQPQADQHYKVVFDISSASDEADMLNAGLDHVARAVNVFASAGVPVNHLDFVAVVHGPATSAAPSAIPYGISGTRSSLDIGLTANSPVACRSSAVAVNNSLGNT